MRCEESGTLEKDKEVSGGGFVTRMVGVGGVEAVLEDYGLARVQVSVGRSDGLRRVTGVKLMNGFPTRRR